MQEVLRWWLCAANKHVIFSSTCLLDKKNSKATEMRINLWTATYSHIQNYCIHKNVQILHGFHCRKIIFKLSCCQDNERYEALLTSSHRLPGVWTSYFLQSVTHMIYQKNIAVNFYHGVFYKIPFWCCTTSSVMDSSKLGTSKQRRTDLYEQQQTSLTYLFSIKTK